MGNKASSKKQTETPPDVEGANAQDSPVKNAINQIEGADTAKSDNPKKKKEKVKKEKKEKKGKLKDKVEEDSVTEQKGKKEKVKKEKKKEEKKEKKAKKEEKKEEKKAKKEKEKKDKKEKKKSKQKIDYKELTQSFQAADISDLTNSCDVTNFNGDTRNLEDAITISVKIEANDLTDDMRDTENTRPISVYEGRIARPVSPKGPGVSALREKFGAKATGTPVRPISYPAARFTNDTPKAELHEAVHRKSAAFNRLEDTPLRLRTGNGNADGNVSALKQKFGGTNAVSPPSPTSPIAKYPTSFATPTTKVAATPSKFGGVANRWQPKQTITPNETKTPAKTHQDHRVTPTATPTTTTTTARTTTPSISALRNRYNNNSEDRTSVKPDGEQANVSPDMKRRKADEEKRAEKEVQKENEKNRSPRKHWRDWSPKKEAKTPSRESSPTKDASPRKRKSVVLNRFRSKSKSNDKEIEESPLISKTIVDNKAQEEEKERARQRIANRTSALIHGVNSTPKTTTPSRTQFEESVPKRTRRDDKPKERPKTEYNFQNVSTPRPKSVADTNQLFASPGNYGNMTPVKGTNIIKNPTTKTQKLLQWCQIHTQGYDGVCVSNFSSSWADGLAFCALVHKFFPSAIRFNTLNSNNQRHNLDLAFSMAEKYAKVPRLLDTDDMIEMGAKPDWKCVFTYVTSLYAGLNKYA